MGKNIFYKEGGISAKVWKIPNFFRFFFIPSLTSTCVQVVPSLGSVSQERLESESDDLPVFNIENLPPGSRFKALVFAKVSQLEMGLSARLCRTGCAQIFYLKF